MNQFSSRNPGIKKVVVKSPSSAQKTFEFPDRIWILIVFILAFILYANSIPNKFVLDDFGVLKDNWVVKRGVAAIPLILQTPYRYGINMFTDDLYRPLSLIMFAVEWNISPNTPALHHFFNVLLFALSCCLLFVLLRKLFVNESPLLPLLVTLIWTAHPIHTEVVANIKSRDEILSILFIFVALIFFTDYLKKNKILYLILAVIAYFLSFMSKEGAITMLAVFPLLAWFFATAGIKKNLLASGIMVIPALAYLLIRKSVLVQFDVPSVISVVDNLLMAAPDISTRIAMAVLIMGKYMFLLVFPYQLVSDYSYNQIPVTGWSNPLAIISLVLYLAALTYALANIRKRTIPAFGILLYLITFSIYSNLFVLIGSSFGERFLYLPSVGFAIVLGWLILRVFKIKTELITDYRPAALFKRFPALWVVIGVILGLYSIKTLARNSEWKDQWALFSADIGRSPDSAHLRYYWGLTLRDRAKEQSDPQEYRKIMQQAAEEFQKGLAIYPSYAECYHQLGLAWFRLGDNEKALENYYKSIALNPTEAVPYANMGIIYFQKGDYPKTLELYKKALSLDPHYADAYCNLGSTYGTLGKMDSAVVNFKKAIEYDPESANAYYFLAITYRSMNKPELAAPCFDKASQLNPALKK
ncbi:MAG: tetratricopeptide repeat protein [bacterium]